MRTMEHGTKREGCPDGTRKNERQTAAIHCGSVWDRVATQGFKGPNAPHTRF